MPSATIKRYRLECDLTALDTPVDRFTGRRFSFVRGFAARVEFGLFVGRDQIVDDITDWSAVRLEIFPVKTPGNTAPDDGTAALMAKQVASGFATLTLAQWQAGTAQHATIDFTAAETANVPAGEVWLVAKLTNGSTVVLLGLGRALCLQPGAVADVAAAIPVTTYQRGTAALALDQANGSVVFTSAFAAAPVVGRPLVVAPDGTGAAIDVLVHTLTASGFAFELSTPAPATGYILHFFALSAP